MRITERDNDTYEASFPSQLPRDGLAPSERAVRFFSLDGGTVNCARVRVVQVFAEPGNEWQLWELYRISRIEGSMANHADGGVATIRDGESGEMVGCRKLPSWAAAERYFEAELRRARRTAIGWGMESYLSRG